MSTRYVWQKWNTARVAQKQKISGFLAYTTQASGDKYPYEFQTTYYYSESVSISQNGTISLNDPTARSWAYSSNPFRGTYWKREDSSTIYSGGTGSGTCLYTIATNTTTYREYINDTTDYPLYKIAAGYSQGSTSYGNISSTSSSKYPSNSYSGSYWYVYQGSDSIDPTAVTYSTSTPKVGQSVKITATPRSNTYGGTISYKYEYTTNGSTWTTINSGTTATSVYVTIPTGATTFQARVTASDNMGFTSTTAVTGSSATVYNIDPIAVTYDAESLIAGDELTLVITPSDSSYPDTITYVVQTNVDGAGWETATESTSTNIPLTIPTDAVSWTVRVYAKTSDFTSSVYVYGNGTSDGVEVKHGVGFNVIPENKHLGYLGSAELMQYYVSTVDNVSYVCAISLDGETISSTSQTPGMKTLTISTDRWETLTSGEEHTIEITATCNGKSITRTYTFNKFVYDASTLPGLLDGVAEAIKIKTGVNRQLWGYKLPMEILKITDSADTYITAYIDVTATYVSGMKVVAVSSTGEVYSTNADSSGTTRLEVSEKGDYIVTAKIGDIPSESKKVQISTDGEVGATSVSFIKLTVTTKAGATVTVALDSQSYTSTATGGSAVFYLPQKGTWSVTGTSGDQTVTKTIDITAYDTYTIGISLYDETFGNNTWESIQSATQAGLASSYWNVGDTKAVTMNGGVGGLTFSNETYYAFIIGFDHNQSYEGTNRLHMMLGKTSGGTQVAFYSFYMNSSNTTSGGWNGSYMRGTIMPAFKAAFPSDLKAVLGSCTKYTHNTTGGSGNDTSSNVTATTESVFLLAEYEVFGSRAYANSYEKNKQAQYAYFKNGNSKVFYQHSSTGNAVYWWLRSPGCDDATTGGFCLVGAGGNASYDGASYSCGVAPAFIIS